MDPWGVRLTLFPGAQAPAAASEVSLAGVAWGTSLAGPALGMCLVVAALEMSSAGMVEFFVAG